MVRGPTSRRHQRNSDRNIIIIIIIIISSQQYRSRGIKAKLKVEEMLERLYFVLGGCVGEGTQNNDRIVWRRIKTCSR